MFKVIPGLEHVCVPQNTLKTCGVFCYLLFSKIKYFRNLICSPQASTWMHTLNILCGKLKYLTLNVLSFLYQAHLKSRAGKMRKSLQITQKGEVLM